jgi:hypothetical protein
MILSEKTIDGMVKKFREIRKRVWSDATRPDPYDQVEHLRVQELLKTRIIQLCAETNFNRYNSAQEMNEGNDGKGTNDESNIVCTPLPGHDLWHLLWTINRFAGIRSRIAAKEIADIAQLFDNREWFDSSEWNIEITTKNRKPTLVRGGLHVHHFLDRTGPFEGCQTVGNLHKLKKIVDIARAFNNFIRLRKDSEPITSFVTNGYASNQTQEIHRYLVNEVGYRNDLTALHAMMDMGLGVIKPDIVITRLFLNFGWLHQVIPDLPYDLNIDDLQGRGKYKSRYKYTHARIYWPIIWLANQISDRLDPRVLKEDIGWVTNNLIREFDIFLVKYGQKPDEEFGIMRKLANWDGNFTDEDDEDAH